MTAILTEEVSKLSPAEKMKLAADLWDEVAGHAANLPVPADHQRILEERLAAHEADPSSALTLQEFSRRLAAME